MEGIINKVSGQFIQDTIPEARNTDCGECQILEVENQRLRKLMQGWDKVESEIKIEAVQEFMNKVINNQFYSKDALITFYRNYIKGLTNEK